MKIHICDLNYSNWSDPILGYGSNLEQVRYCKVCNRVNRKIYSGTTIISSLDSILKALKNIKETSNER